MNNAGGIDFNEVKCSNSIAVYLKDKVYEGMIKLIYKDCILAEIELDDDLAPEENEEIYINLCIDNKVYKCVSKVIGTKEENYKKVLLLSPPKIMDKIERRKYYRINLGLGIKYTILPKTRYYENLFDIPSKLISKPKNAITMDISGGGAKILCSQYAEEDTQVVMSIFMPQRFDILCRVVRCDIHKVNRKYKIALEYKNMDEVTRDKLIEFIFDKHSKVLEKQKSLKED